jgi:hypothetical protein
MSRSLVKLDVDLTLMMLGGDGDYRPSSVMTFQYFAAANDDFLADLQVNAKNLMIEIYNEHFRTFRERAPEDLNYIAVVGVAAEIIDPATYPSKPWLQGSCPAWEESNLIGLHADGYNKLSPGFFEGVLHSAIPS